MMTPVHNVGNLGFFGAHSPLKYVAPICSVLLNESPAPLYTHRAPDWRGAASCPGYPQENLPLFNNYQLKDGGDIDTPMGGRLLASCHLFFRFTFFGTNAY